MSADPEIVKAMRNNLIVPDHSGDTWSDEDKATLKRRFDDGAGITEMSIELQRSEEAIFQQISKMDLYDRTHYPKRRRSIPQRPGCLCHNCQHYQDPCPIRDRCMEFKEDI